MSSRMGSSSRAVNFKPENSKKNLRGASSARNLTPSTRRPTAPKSPTGAPTVQGPTLPTSVGSRTGTNMPASVAEARSCPTATPHGTKDAPATSKRRPRYKVDTRNTTTDITYPTNHGHGNKSMTTTGAQKDGKATHTKGRTQTTWQKDGEAIRTNEGGRTQHGKAMQLPEATVDGDRG